MPTSVSETPATPPQILVGATFTASPLGDPLQFWIAELNLPHHVDFAPYQQLFQSLISPASPFSANEKGANVVLFRPEDLGPHNALTEIEQHAGELVQALVSASQVSKAPFIVCLCPPSSCFLESAERQQFSTRIAGTAETILKRAPNIHVISADRTIARYQVTEVHDRTAERTGHIPYHSAFFTALATEVARMVVALERKPLKVIAFDCDNTLWTGVCGEDGPLGVQVDRGRVALQSCLLKQKQAGVLLAIASKNNEADVRETFAANPDMKLKWDDIVAHRIDWDSKSRNLLELAAELNLGIDSFAFLDDDAKECAEVLSELPEVTTLQIPHETGSVARFLDHVWIFDHLQGPTPEDQRRSKLYAEQIERSRFEKQASDLREFIAGLRLEIVFAPVTSGTLPRAAQLTQRTNQMNTSLVRYGEAELNAALDSGEQEAFTVSVSDRFGSYGTAGLAMFKEQGNALEVKNFLLSCRALGRGVEHKMLTRLAEICAEREKEVLRLHVSRGPRNQPAIQFLESVIGRPLPDGEVIYIDCRGVDLSNLEWPGGDSSLPEGTKPSRSPEKRTNDTARAINYGRIATAFRTEEQIAAAIRQRRREQAAPRRISGTPPQNGLQTKLALIWCDLLGIESVGIEEDFFDLGGHSLLAVQLLSRINQEIGIDLPDSVIYADKLRIDNLTRAIELQSLGVDDQSVYEAMLAEIESLSDEEVAALLAGQENRN